MKLKTIIRVYMVYIAKSLDRVLRDEYCFVGNLLEQSYSNGFSYVWRSIMKVATVLKEGFKI